MNAQGAAREESAGDFLRVEEVGIEPVPAAERTTQPWELAGVWAGAFSNYATLLTGSLLLTFGLGVTDSLTAIAAGAILAGVVLGLLSVSGPRGGVPQIVFSRAIFGYRGAYLAGVLTLFLAVGWFAVDCVIATDALRQMVGLLGLAPSPGLRAGLLLLVVSLSVLVAIYGHRTVVIFERFGAGIFLLFCGLLFVALFPKIHWHLAPVASGSAHLGAWVLGASVTFALVASWFSFASDYSRYVPESTRAAAVTGWVTAGSVLPMLALGALGVLLLSINPRSGDVLSVVVSAAPRPLAVAFLLFVALGMIWANYLDVYTGGLVALALDVPLRRWQTALLAGGIGGALSYYALFVTSFDQAYTNFLLVTYIWAPAWAAVVLLNLLLRRLPYRRDEFFQRSSVRWPALVSVVVGTVFALPFVNSSLWQSPLSIHYLQGADVSGFVSFVMGGVTFLLLDALTIRHRTNSLSN